MKHASDKELLDRVLACEQLTEEEREAFSGMLNDFLACDGLRALSIKQRQWLRQVENKHGLEVSENLWSAGKVPAGKHVDMPWMQPIPKRPGSK